MHTQLNSWLAGARDDMKDDNFRDFRHRLFHGCLTVINTTIKPYMQMWDLVQCSDHHFRRTIYGLGPHITDYPEQLVAAGVVYGWCVTYISFLANARAHTNSVLVVTLIPRTSITQQPSFAHGTSCWRSSKLRMMMCYGLAMELSLTFWWVHATTHSNKY